MRYCANWEAISRRYEAYWARENHDQPILNIVAPNQKEAPLPSHGGDHRARWMDTQYNIEQANWHMRNTFYAGDAYPAYNPDLGPDFFAACYGAPIEFGESTSWAIHTIDDAQADAQEFPEFDTQNQYYKKMLEMTRAAAQDGRDKYIVGITDIHPGVDALVSMRGPAKLCMDVYDRPEFIKRGAQHFVPGYKRLVDELYDITTQYQRGSANWMGIWHPGKWYVTSCDFICMIAPDMFEPFITDVLLQELDFLDASIFHLDGPDALRHLDTLLAIPSLKGIQWVYGAGQPTAWHWLEVLRKIQRAGKCIQVNATAQELPVLLENLEPQGVMYNIYAPDADAARALTQMAQRHKK